MRVLIATNFFGYGAIGGTEVLTLGLAQGLQRLGHEVRVLCADHQADTGSHRAEGIDETFEGIHVHRLRFDWREAPDPFKYLYDNPEIEAYLDRYATQYRPDIAHITSCYTLTASIITSLHRLSIPIVLTATDFWFLCARNTLLHSDGSLCSGPETAEKCARCMLADSGWFRCGSSLLPEAALAPVLEWIGRAPFLTRARGLRGMHGNWDDRFLELGRAIRKTSCVVTASAFLRDLFVRYGVDGDRIRLSPYGFDTSWSHRYRQKAPHPELRLGFIGQLVPMKGADILVQAIRRLKSSVPVRLAIFGDLEKDKQFGRRLQDLAQADSRIAFAGTFEPNRIGEVLQNIDALVVPSIWYDFPLVVPSAFATLTPVLATDLPGMNELVAHERNGLLFPRGDISALSRLIERLAGDRESLARLRDGMTPVRDTHSMAQDYEALYRSVSPPADR